MIRKQPKSYNKSIYLRSSFINTIFLRIISSLINYIVSSSLGYVRNLIAYFIRYYCYTIMLNLLHDVHVNSVLSCFNSLVCKTYHFFNKNALVYVLSFGLFGCLYLDSYQELIYNTYYLMSFICFYNFYVKNKWLQSSYPLLHTIVNYIFLLILIYLTYSIFINIYDIYLSFFRDLQEIICNYILKMLSATLKTSDKGPSPVGGGGEDPGKRPGQGDFYGCGPDKTSDHEDNDSYNDDGDDYDDDNDNDKDNDNDNSGNNDSADNNGDNTNNWDDNCDNSNKAHDSLDGHKVTKPRRSNIKYTAGSRPDELEQWEKDDLIKTNRKTANKKHQQTAKYKETKAKYNATSVGKRVSKESTERYEKSSFGQENRKKQRRTEKAKLLSRETTKKYYDTHKEKMAEKIANRSDDYKLKQSEASKKRYRDNLVEKRLENKERATKRRKEETTEQREARLTYLREYYKKKREEKKKK